MSEQRKNKCLMCNTSSTNYVFCHECSSTFCDRCLGQHSHIDKYGKRYEVDLNKTTISKKKPT